ncbi:hypothetical protein ABZ313_35370 [Streptomyces sp. NPDC006251]|uniref:hypothetical protein n=1 Tax=Streptomyces sp. NPDC006251 TaxID=3155718 RepID=UPI0033B08C3E
MAEAYDPSVRTQMWHWYSEDHALAATLFSRKCGELEKNPEEEQRREHRSYAGASILASVAFMEASINELLASSSQTNLGFGGALGGLPQDEREALTALMRAWGDRRGPGTLDRVQLVLHLLRRQPFDPGASPFQNAPQVVSLRNALVHYSPEWQIGVGASEEDAIKGIAKQLGGKFSENPFVPKEYPFFPDRCLSHGCTVWAWNIVFGLVDEFFKRVGVTPVYNPLRDQLKP